MYKITRLFKNRYFKILFLFTFSFLVTFYTFLDVKQETSKAIAPAVAPVAVAPAVVQAIVVALIALGVTYATAELVEYTIQELDDEVTQTSTSMLISRLQDDFKKQEDEQNDNNGDGKKKFKFDGKDLLDLAQAIYDILNSSDDDIKVDVMKECSYGHNSFNVAHPGRGKTNVIASIPLPRFSRLVSSSDPLYTDNNYYSIENVPPYPVEPYVVNHAYLNVVVANGKPHTLVIYSRDYEDSVYLVFAAVIPTSNLWEFPTNVSFLSQRQFFRLSKPSTVNFNIEWEQNRLPKGTGSISGSSYPVPVTIPRSTLGDTTNISVPPSMQDGVTVVVPPNPTRDLGLPSVSDTSSSFPPLTIAQTGATLQDGKNRDIDVSTLESGSNESGILNSILSFFGNFFGKLADLFGLLLKSLFIPSDTYFSNYFDDIKSAFEVKLKPDDFTKIFQVDFGTKRIPNIKVTFFGVECTIVNFDYFYANKPNFDKWARGVFYALLGIYNYSQIYRLIRGTAYSSVGKESEGGKKK